jgi:SNF2 family DNA or RNA helicase
MNKEINYNAMLANLLSKISQDLVTFLNENLPKITEDYWKNAVFNKLTYNQIKFVKENNINKLKELDLAALLSVFDKNWQDLCFTLNLKSSDITFLKEMRLIRNRWAHSRIDGFENDLVYRDIDTIKRFAQLIKANETTLNEIESQKKKVLQLEASAIETVEKIYTEPIPEDEAKVSSNKSKIEKGSMVSLKGSPEISGAVTEIVFGGNEVLYKVFFPDGFKELFESQIELKQKKENEPSILELEKLHAILTAKQLTKPSSSSLYSLQAAKIDFVPYQFRPVMKFIKADRPRLLIADGVGVGKTIEAGLILKELQARRDLESILIICPKPLVTEKKWLNEMKRFDQRFLQLDGKGLRYCLEEFDKEGDWPIEFQKTIIPYSIFDEELLAGNDKGKKSAKPCLTSLDPAPRFDLVIVDEAHHIRNSDTIRHKTVKFFCDNAEAVIFLTATPIQLGNNDLYTLLNTLRPDLVIDTESFKLMSEPNPFINEAIDALRTKQSDLKDAVLKAMEKAKKTLWGEKFLKGNPEVNFIEETLSQNQITNEDRVILIDKLEKLHTFASIINRTRRRDIDNFAIRKPETIICELLPRQRQLHDQILELYTEVYLQLYDSRILKLIMTTIRRQVSSSVFGLVPLLDEILRRHFEELNQVELLDADEPLVDIAPELEKKINEIKLLAESIEKEDKKFDSLLKVIEEKEKLPNRKMIVFSTFRHTLHYLHKRLISAGKRVGLIHGGTLDEERLNFRNRFELAENSPESLDILLFSEVGCEGLDYQFCDCLVNYDLPWNPMRIEQRIGRIDRKGQKNDTIGIFNLITGDTIDEDIYSRCLLRIGIFNESIGGNEEILGELAEEIYNIADKFEMSALDRQSKLEQLTDNKIRLIKEQQELEKKQFELFGVNLSNLQVKKEIDAATNFWLSPAAIENLVKKYFEKLGSPENEFFNQNEPIKKIKLNKTTRIKLLEDFKKLNMKRNTVGKNWEKLLKNAPTSLKLTFDNFSAARNPKVEFINFTHPLVVQASNSFKDMPKQKVFVETSTKELPAGKYPFSIYAWNFKGIRENTEIRFFTPEKSNNDLIQRFVKSGFNGSKNEELKLNFENDWKKIEKNHYINWRQTRQEHKNYVQQVASFKKTSLDQSHAARITLLQEQYEKNPNEKIKKMRASQIASANYDYNKRLQEIEIKAERADIITNHLINGILIVKEEA